MVIKTEHSGLIHLTAYRPSTAGRGGNCILLVPGFGDPSGMNLIAQKIADSGTTAVVMDLPGHGKSNYLGWAGHKAVAKGVVEKARKEGYEIRGVIGHSLGALIAGHVAKALGGNTFGVALSPAALSGLKNLEGKRSTLCRNGLLYTKTLSTYKPRQKRCL